MRPKAGPATAAAALPASVGTLLAPPLPLPPPEVPVGVVAPPAPPSVVLVMVIVPLLGRGVTGGMGFSSGMLEKMAGTEAEPVMEVSMLTVTEPKLSVGATVAEPEPAEAAKALQASEAACWALTRSSISQASVKQGVMMGWSFFWKPDSHWQAVSSSSQPALGMYS